MLRSSVLATSALCVLLTAGCGGDKPPATTPRAATAGTPAAPDDARTAAPFPEDMAKAAASVDRFHALAAAADEAAYFAMFDEGGVSLGTARTSASTR